MKNENMEMVQNIVTGLEKYASGGYFLHNGELFPIDYDDFNAIDAVYMKYKEYKEKIKAAKTKQEISEAYYELSGKLF